MRIKCEHNIEIFRILLMVGICVLHANNVAQGNPFYWLNSYLCCCVVAFVFISGYFGIKFQLSKVVRLYCAAIVCCTMSYAVFGWQSRNWVDLFRGSTMYVRGSWFLHAYIVLMFLAPVVNRLLPQDLDKRNGDEIHEYLSPLILLFVLVFGLAWVRGFPGCHLLPFPSDPAMTDFSGTTLIAIYAVARIYRIFNWDRRLPIWLIMVSLTMLPLLTRVSIHGCTLGFWRYNSVVTLFIAIALFTIFRRWKLSSDSFLCRHDFWLLLTPSLFPVYLIHAHPEWYSFMRNCGGGVPAGLAVFGLCIAMDVPRRLFVWTLKKPINAICELIDSVFDRLIARMVGRMV